MKNDMKIFYLENIKETFQGWCSKLAGNPNRTDEAKFRHDECQNVYSRLIGTKLTGEQVMLIRHLIGKTASAAYSAGIDDGKDWEKEAKC